MSFLSLPPLAVLALLATVAGAIGLLYRMRPPRTRLDVGSTLLWRRALRGSTLPSMRRRWLRSLLIALLIGLALALALTRPQLPSIGAAQQRLVLILDSSSSMGARTRDGRTRWQHALAGARRLLQEAPAGSEALIADTTGRAPLTGFVPVEHAVDALAHLSLSAQPNGRVPPLPPAAASMHTVLFTDGVGVDDVPSEVIVHSVFEAADNIGITAFEGRSVANQPDRYEVLVRLENAAAHAERISLQIAGSNGFRLERSLPIAPGSSSQIVDVSAYAQGALRAQVHAPGDAFDLDDSAYCIVPPHRVRRVLLVTEGNEALEDSLRTLPALELKLRRPSAFTAAEPFDAYVFDRFAPPAPPPAGALLFRPPEVPWLALQWRSSGTAQITDWDASHPLTAGVSWLDLRLSSARLIARDAAAVVNARSANSSEAAALIVTGRAHARWVAAGFALADSSFPLQPGFPVFLGSALDWLAERPTLLSEGLGRIEVPVAHARIDDARYGAIAAVATPRGTSFEAPRPGIYVASNGGERVQIVANVTDARSARINDTRLRTDSAGTQTSRHVRPGWPEPWIALLAAAFVLLALEWVAFRRRLTE